MGKDKLTLGFLTGSANENRQTQFKRHEKQIADDLGGRTTIGSGNKGMKGDVQTKKVMAEAKSTDKKQISLKMEWLEKLVREALEAGMEPVLYIRFLAMQYAGRRDWAVIPAERYKELLETERIFNALPPG